MSISIVCATVSKFKSFVAVCALQNFTYFVALGEVCVKLSFSNELSLDKRDDGRDESAANPRYGGITMREAVLKLMRPKKQYPPPEDAPDSELQLGL